MKTFKIYSIYSTIVLVFIGLVWLMTLTSASDNVAKGRPNQYEFAADTIEEDGTTQFILNQQLKNKTGYMFQITSSVVADTVLATAYIRESAWDTESRWVNKDTISITGPGNYRVEGTTRARRLQLYIVADTTTQTGLHYVAAQTTEEF